MRIAIVGAGGVGGLLGGLLARAGTEVAVIARGAHGEALRAQGLRIESPLGNFTARLAAVSDDPAALGRADAVLVAVKAWQVADLAPRLAPLVDGGGVAVPLQNGVEAAARLEAALGEERVAGGLSAMLTWIAAPGTVKHVGAPPRVRVGERGPRAGRPSARLDALVATLRAAGVDAAVEENIERAVWEKFLLIEPWGTVAAASRAPAGPLRTVPETRALLRAAQDEVVRLAQARGVALGEDAIARSWGFIDAAPPEATVSMQRDLGGGRPSELADQTGAVLRLAAEAGVPVPVHAALHAVLLPQELAARTTIPAFQRT